MKHSDTVPNPAKVVVIFEELGIPYQGKYLELPEIKSEPFISINPNGRLPGISDLSALFMSQALTCNHISS